MSWNNSGIRLIIRQQGNKRKIYKTNKQRQTHKKEITNIIPKKVTKIL